MACGITWKRKLKFLCNFLDNFGVFIDDDDIGICCAGLLVGSCRLVTWTLTCLPSSNKSGNLLCYP